MGTTAAQKKLFFNLRKLKGQMQAIDDGDLSPEHVTSIATRLNVTETDVVQMNRRIGNPTRHSTRRYARKETASGRTGLSIKMTVRKCAWPRPRS